MTKGDVNFRIASALGSLFGPKTNEKEEWLNRPNTNFNDFSPLEFIQNGYGEVLAMWLEKKLQEQED
jgi:hypothetical protein